MLQRSLCDVYQLQMPKITLSVLKVYNPNQIQKFEKSLIPNLSRRTDPLHQFPSPLSSLTAQTPFNKY